MFPRAKWAAVMGRGGAFNPLSLSPVAWWRLDDGSGASAVDSSGNGYTLALQNTPTWISGQVNGGLNFAAASAEHGETTAAALRTVLQGLATFTIAYWARAAAYQFLAAGLSIHDAGDVNALLVIYPYDDSGGNGVRIWWNGTTVINQNSGAASVDEWHFFVFVSRSATDHEMFVDNVSVASSSTSKSLAATIAGIQVASWESGPQRFNGDMDEVFIFDRALSAAEMTKLYQWAG